MAKAKIIAAFKDKQTGKIISPGAAIDVTDNRLDKLIAAGCAKRVTESSPVVEHEALQSQEETKPAKRRGRPPKKR